MKFTTGFTLFFLMLCAVLLVITQLTAAKPDFWTWAQMVFASLIFGYIFGSGK